MFVDVVILLVANFKIKSSAKYRQSINYSQLALYKKSHIKNVVRATHDLVISQSSYSIIQIMCENLNLLCMLNIISCMSLPKNTVLSLPINHIVILNPALPQESPPSRH